MSLKPICRVVTGHSADGRSFVNSKGFPPVTLNLSDFPGTTLYEVWSTSIMPVLIDDGDDPTVGPTRLMPATNGTCIRFVDIPPGSGGETASAEVPMHRTETLNYVVVVDGELMMLLDDEEVLLQAGSVVVQRGTNHAWVNRSGKPCRVLFVLLDGEFDPRLARSLPATSGVVPNRFDAR